MSELIDRLRKAASSAAVHYHAATINEAIGALQAQAQQQRGPRLVRLPSNLWIKSDEVLAVDETDAHLIAWGKAPHGTTADEAARIIMGDGK